MENNGRLLVILLFLVPATVHASDWYLDLHGYSKHANWEDHIDLELMPELSSGFVEVNPGFGVTYKTGWRSIGAGTYVNSLGRKAKYISIGASYDIASWLSCSISGGIATGYLQKYSPVLIPSASIGADYQIVIGGMPEIKNITPAVTYISFRLRLY